MNIILASSSTYRKNLLERLIKNFQCISPEIDESIQSNESATEYVTRLAMQKANAVSRSLHAEQAPTLVIGSDQCAVLNNQIITKPSSPEMAFQQLQASSGNTVTFYTGICVINTKTKTQQIDYETFQVEFRNLTAQQIKAYLEKDQPYDCAGSFKAEGLGISLFNKMLGDDYNTLIGLPLIKLTSMLNKEGFDVLTQNRIV